MKIAVATDFFTSGGHPQPMLRYIAEAGFTSLHWCHQWCTDYLYSKYEFSAFKKCLKETGLTLLDIHGSAGSLKYWCSPEEYIRKSGVELAVNRLEMLDALDAAGTLMMHIPRYPFPSTPEGKAQTQPMVEAMKRTFDDLMPYLEMYDRKIAVENMWNDDWEVMDIALSYPAERIGICYDSGHANSRENPQMERLAARKNRLEALHLHDNDGTGDQHQPPFYGNVDWAKLTQIIGTSSYPREISFELSIRNTPFNPGEKNYPEAEPEIRAFLKDAHERCSKVGAMLEAVRAAKG